MVNVQLDRDERALLLAGLNQWGGPAYATEDLALAMGFDDAEEVEQRCIDLYKLIETGDRLSRSDWARALVATEICFGSHILGAARDWRIVTGISDIDSFIALRRLQDKLAPVVVDIRSGGLW